ncbi:50S ribosomal protein L2 [Candidatus Woesearchaeota archaeon]|nr:50S ribosomal protein L2 [Candidatus Woesearchaeota archaeon]
MGKNLIQQRRGKGSFTYRSPSFRFFGEVKHPSLNTPTDNSLCAERVGKVLDIVHCAGHTAPLLELAFNDHSKGLAFAPENVCVGDNLTIGGTELKEGNVLRLKDIVEGTLIHNIELNPGDGGKLVRSSGTFAKVIARAENNVRVLLPSGKEKLFSPTCRAGIGVLAGGGRLEKPFLKAGTHYKKMRARNKLYPKVCGISMNAVDHPFGGKCSHIKGRPTQSPRSAPPGRKVGKIAPSRTGRRK